MVIGLDVGGTTFNAACVDDAGRILLSREYPTHQSDAPDVMLPRLAAAIAEVRDALEPAQRAQVNSVGVGVPGPVKPREGVCVYAPNLEGWTNLPVAAMLREKLDLPIHLINDADAAALGEARFGAGRGIDDLLVLTLGTGIGGG
jgi:glucokinase